MDLFDHVYRNKIHPYYIYAPRWIDTSAGIRALHYFCHSLNTLGQKAYLILAEDNFKSQPRISGFLNTPILTQEIADSHFNAKLTPVTILSETVPGNPVNAPLIVRYLMNYIGALSGPKEFNIDEIIIGFSKNITENAKNVLKREDITTLFIPPVDPRDFKFSTHKRENLIAIYAGKFRAFIGEPPGIQGQATIEILRQGKGAQTREEVIELLQRVKAVVSFENSSIITEAVLSGIPGIFQPNEFLDSAIAEHELGWEGMAWCWSEKNFTSAQDSVHWGRENYLRSISVYLEELQIFVEKTQLAASSTGYLRKMNVPKYRYLISRHRIRLAWQILKSNGVRTLIRVTLDFIKRRLKFSYWTDQEKKYGGENLLF